MMCFASRKFVESVQTDGLCLSAPFPKYGYLFLRAPDLLIVSTGIIPATTTPHCASGRRSRFPQFAARGAILARS
jgi:hypothetical protein